MTPNQAQLPSLTSQPTEATPVALEMAATHRRLVEYYRNQCKMGFQEALDLADHPVDAAREYQIRTCEPDQVMWSDLHALANRDPSLSYQLWEEIKKVAGDELRTGHRAAKAMESSRMRPWDRAQFLVLRDELAQQWQPTNGIERTLIDTLAQSHTAYLQWLEKLTLYSGAEPHNDRESIEERGCWRPPRVADAQAIEQAGTMAERFHRLFLRTLRALTDLRRRSQPMVIRARQVNVGQQQVNMTPGAAPGPPLTNEDEADPPEGLGRAWHG